MVPFVSLLDTQRCHSRDLQLMLAWQVHPSQSTTAIMRHHALYSPPCSPFSSSFLLIPLPSFSPPLSLSPSRPLSLPPPRCLYLSPSLLLSICLSHFPSSSLCFSLSLPQLLSPLLSFSPSHRAFVDNSTAYIQVAMAWYIVSRASN